MLFQFSAVAESEPGLVWKSTFARLWPAYEAWWQSERGAARPTYLQCRQALREHMPEMVPIWEQLVELAGGGDLAARFLSLYRPPAYLTGCSQAIWSGQEPVLVRNYDYSPKAFEGLLLRSGWKGVAVMGMSDCLIGLLDGVNESGLAVSLAFGGTRTVGDGFGVPIILRYVLQTCQTAEEASRVLARIPTHMAYNVTVLDRSHARFTVYLAPGREAIITDTAVATNHQEPVEWEYARATASIERERYLLQLRASSDWSQAEFIGAFLKSPLNCTAFDCGFGTLYTAAYRTVHASVELAWLNSQHRVFALDRFQESRWTVNYGPSRSG
jgi:predicted choloylglycine hydrolase